MRARVSAARDGTNSPRGCRPLPLVAAIALCFSVSVPAAIFTVNTGNLTHGVGNCTLLDAVNSINQGSLVSGTDCSPTGNIGLGGDTIVLKSFAFAFSDQSAGGSISGDTAIVMLPNKPLTLIGDVDVNDKPLATIQRSPSAAAFRLIQTSSRLSLIGVKLQNGVANAGNGGALNVTGHDPIYLTNSTISGNSAAASGGGIYSTAALTITDSTVSGNIAGTGNGGGIMSTYTALSIDNSTISGNTAAHGQGGGIFDDTANIELTNSTVQGNYAQRGGGGIYTDTTTLDFCTISGNTTQSGNLGSGLLVKAYSTANATLIYANSPDNDVDAQTAGTSLGGGYNLVGTHGSNISVPANTKTCDPQLRALSDNAGATQTMPLTETSCAFNSGPAMPPRDLLNDQRGNHYPRLVGTATDIGAFEVQPFDRIFIDGFES